MMPSHLPVALNQALSQPDHRNPNSPDLSWLQTSIIDLTMCMMYMPVLVDYASLTHEQLNVRAAPNRGGGGGGKLNKLKNQDWLQLVAGEQAWKPLPICWSKDMKSWTQPDQGAFLNVHPSHPQHYYTTRTSTSMLSRPTLRTLMRASSAPIEKSLDVSFTWHCLKRAIL